ncbi:MAG: hypothetical protein CO027_00700 [Candidatus Komeilibacteria bacterium CG_4_9_14_0_2_um_filter_36_13]|nr:MAG: hypothetical protein CO027_00700 [Candidatus Komeilibacteria bacterium CG_4_9_14_0_2_um_filter_36_13]
MHQISLEQFEGPLDLLLQLIEKNKLQVTEISLAQITDQYLDYIAGSEQVASEEMADFLLIASKLIYLKSKYLLPDLSLEDEDDADSLEKQLKIYRQYYEASEKINKFFINKHQEAYIRQTPYKFDLPKSFITPQNTSLNILGQIFKEILGRVERIVNLPKLTMVRAISISEKIQQIKNLIKNNKSINFSFLLKEKKDKTETVVSFLAMLELVKQREIVVSQTQLFGELSINRYYSKINN